MEFGTDHSVGGGGGIWCSLVGASCPGRLSAEMGYELMLLGGKAVAVPDSNGASADAAR